MEAQINIKELLEKYFEGQTSLKEEKMLREYFKQTNIPESLEIYKPMFMFFNDEVEAESVQVAQTKKSSRIVWIRWTSMSIAAAFILFFGIKLTFFDTQKSKAAQSIVYIDGKKFTDIQTIQKETLNALDAFSSTNDDVISAQIDMLESFDSF